MGIPGVRNLLLAVVTPIYNWIRGPPCRWRFQISSIFTLITGEMIQFDKHIFKWGGSTVQPPTSLGFGICGHGISHQQKSLQKLIPKISRKQKLRIDLFCCGVSFHHKQISWKIIPSSRVRWRSWQKQNRSWILGAWQISNCKKPSRCGSLRCLAESLVMWQVMECLKKVCYLESIYMFLFRYRERFAFVSVT